MATAIPNAANEREVDATTPVVLHPLVIVNITDHFTRVTGRNAGSRAVGVLLGQQSGRRIEIFTSFELLYEPAGDSVNVDIDFLRSRRDSFLAVFPDYDIVGWYTTGKGLTSGDLENIHRRVFLEQSESAVALVLDPSPEAGSKALPVYIFESRGREGAVAKVPYTVESEESERIGVEAGMKVEFQDDGNAGLEPAAVRLRSAVYMLRDCIGVVVRYLDGVQKGAIEPDYELLRRIADVINQLPHGDSPQLLAAINADTRDALLIAFLGVVSKGVAQLAHLSADTAVQRDGASTKKAARMQMLSSY